jgi:transposase
MADKIAGIDVHKKVVMVVVVDARTPESKPERRRFTNMPGELRCLSAWLQELGVKEAVMESTAQYWRSVWLELEPHMCLHPAQAFSKRAPRGRKHDFNDAERLARLLIAKDLILSFVCFRQSCVIEKSDLLPKGEPRLCRGLEFLHFLVPG